MLEELIGYYADGKKSDMASKLGITPQGISTWLSRNTFDIEIVYSKCENINPYWLLTGKGPMVLKNKDDSTIINESSIPYIKKENELKSNEIYYDIISHQEIRIQELNREIGMLQYQVSILKEKVQEDQDLTQE